MTLGGREHRAAAVAAWLWLSALPVLALAPDPIEAVPVPGPDDPAAPTRSIPVRPSGPGGRPLAILQIGDSHTAADFLTGQVRRQLQAEFGDGGAGYLVPGRPRSGVRSSALKIESSPGWTYQSLQAAKDDRSAFALSGFEAMTAAAGETLTYTAEQPVAFDAIEVDVVTGPNAGGIAVSLDGTVESRFELAAPVAQRVVLRLTPETTAVDRISEVRITTTAAAPVRISGVSVRNRASGLSVSAIGFPGATVDIVNRFDGDAFRQEIARLAPDVVVLAFGTNEGFNDSLDPAIYRETYRRALGRVRRAAPAARIVVAAPPNANRIAPGCKPKAAKALCLAGDREREPAVTGTLVEPEDKACSWRTPPNLARVRDVQRRIAEEEKLTFWNWADVMPTECGAHDGTKTVPPLMAEDHVHMTIAGYRQSADRLIPVLRSLLAQIPDRRDAVPDR